MAGSGVDRSDGRSRSTSLNCDSEDPNVNKKKSSGFFSFLSSLIWKPKSETPQLGIKGASSSPPKNLGTDKTIKAVRAYFTFGIKPGSVINQKSLFGGPSRVVYKALDGSVTDLTKNFADKKEIKIETKDGVKFLIKNSKGDVEEAYKDWDFKGDNSQSDTNTYTLEEAKAYLENEVKRFKEEGSDGSSFSSATSLSSSGKINLESIASRNATPIAGNKTGSKAPKPLKEADPWIRALALGRQAPCTVVSADGSERYKITQVNEELYYEPDSSKDEV